MAVGWVRQAEREAASSPRLRPCRAAAPEWAGPLRSVRQERPSFRLHRLWPERVRAAKQDAASGEPCPEMATRWCLLPLRCRVRAQVSVPVPGREAAMVAER